MRIDAHCHLTNEEEYLAVGGVDAVLQKAAEEVVGLLVCSGYDLPSSQRAKELAERYENVYFCAGFQPEEIGDVSFSEIEKLEELLRHEKCVAVGEIGLDYHFDDNPEREKQKEFFIRQILLAERNGLPIVVHSRDACEDTLNILKAQRENLPFGGLMHCYSYSSESAKEFEKLGFFFSFGGTVTFKNAKRVKESAIAIGKERILTETDSPYLSPEPFRGVFPNTPDKVRFTAKYLAELLQTEEDEFLRAAEENAYKLFRKIKRK